MVGFNSHIRGKPHEAAHVVILDAVFALAEGQTAATVRLEELVLKAWQLDPQRFGLRGYETQYPDAKLVECNLIKSIAVGLVRRAGARLLELTERGCDVAADRRKYPGDTAATLDDMRKEAETKKMLAEFPNF